MGKQEIEVSSYKLYRLKSAANPSNFFNTLFKDLDTKYSKILFGFNRINPLFVDQLLRIFTNTWIVGKICCSKNDVLCFNNLDR